MFFQVFLCVLVIALSPVCSSHLMQETRYECGAHGKFEYCIDGIPGCVIGCHCHPGYYFDTDTKICEPNVKLTQAFRRQYNAETTRIYNSREYSPPVTFPAPTPTTSDNLDENFDELARDTDNLGDWLYNQFFKTIENQVINNTETKPKEKEKEKEKEKAKPLTRRSGGDSGPVISKTRRKTRKSMRSGKKKKHTKVHGLRRKLLRITEDDSLFDSESDSDSSSSSGSSSDSDSDSSSDFSSDSSDSKKSKPGDKDKDDKDHGHKKVIIFNKRPKPPLPSFIFLPSMDTPFYPPIGLPPPPAFPMYPMIPVPPVPPMFPPFPGTPNCDEGESTTTTSGDTTPQHSDADAEKVTEATDPGKITTPETATDKDKQTKRRSRLEKQLGRKLTSAEFAHARDSGKPLKTHAKTNQRNKLMQKLRDKMIAKRLNTPTTSPHEQQEIPLIDQVPLSQEAMMPSHAIPLKSAAERNPMIPKLEDVDFRYLSELIHRVNQSDARSKLAPLPFDLNEDLKQLQKIQTQQQSRRNFNPYQVEPVTETYYGNNQHRNLHRQGTSDDAYYTNLGRQIASMIRNADSKVDQQLNAEIEQTDRPLPYHPVLHENNFTPRSYWERSVRSPLTEIGNYNNYLDKQRTLKHSNEKSLFNLENEVELFASTTNPLSLQDLENILNTMEKAHAHIKYTNPLKFTKHSNYSLNVSLLPKYVRPENKQSRLFNSPDPVEYGAPPYEQPPYEQPPYVPPPYEPPPYEPPPYAPPPYAPPPYAPPPYASPPHVPPPHVPPPYLQPPYLSPPYIQPPLKSIERNATTTNITDPFNTNVQPPKTNIVVPLNDYWMYNSRNLRPKPVTQRSIPMLHEKPVYNTNPTQSTFSAVAAEVAPNKNVPKKSRVEYLQFLKSVPVVKHTTVKRPEPKLITNPPLLNIKSLNYFSGNKHHYMFEEASYPLAQVSFRRQISKPLGKPNPSYFHHELHHFDYFD